MFPLAPFADKESEIAMADKKCKHCAMMIPEEAKICPHCRKQQGWSVLHKIGLVILIAMVISFFVGIMSTDLTTKTYTAEQKKAAKDIRSQYMKIGFIKQLKGEGDLQIVYVDGSLWSRMAFEKKKEFLKQMSVTNEVLGYTPWVEIRNHRSGEVYGAVKPPMTIKIYK